VNKPDRFVVKINKPFMSREWFLKSCRDYSTKFNGRLRTVRVNFVRTHHVRRIKAYDQQPQILLSGVLCPSVRGNQPERYFYRVGQACGPIAARPNCAHWDIEEASLSIRGSKVTSYIKNQFTSQMHNGNLRSFLMQKESCSTQNFDTINWNASERAFRQLSKNHQMNVVKLCKNYWHTGSSYMEETAYAVYVKKPKRTGDTLSTACRWMRATTKMPHGKKSKRTCKCGDSRQTFGQLWKRDLITYQET
jgi:hypothetical protein